MTLHTLKIKKVYGDAILEGLKTFELRKNDRDYKVGDLIQFVTGVGGGLYFPELYEITYILKDCPEYGLDKDYCILAIKVWHNNKE